MKEVCFFATKPLLQGYCVVCESLQTAALQEQAARKASPLKYRRTRKYGRTAKRFSGERPFPCALNSALFRLPIWRVLERRGAAEPLVYSSTRHSAFWDFRYTT